MEVRTMADWVIRQRLLTIPGVAQVFTMGGGRKQFQVLVDPDSLREFGLSMHQVHVAVDESKLERHRRVCRPARRKTKCWSVESDALLLLGRST